MTKFMYLFRRDVKAQWTPSPEQMQQLTQKWMGWVNELKKNGHADQNGQRLEPAGKVVRGKAKTVSDGPFIEVKDAIQGYLMVEAADMEQAVELSKGCPVFEIDGSVEIRPILAA